MPTYNRPTQTDTQTASQTNLHTDREKQTTHTYRDSQTDTYIQRHTNIYIYRPRQTKRDRQRQAEADRQIQTETYRDRHTETDRDIQRQTYRNTLGARLGHHKKLDRAFVSHWLHRNEIQWVQGWSTTEDWIEHLYQLAAPK